MYDSLHYKFTLHLHLSAFTGVSKFFFTTKTGGPTSKTQLTEWRFRPRRQYLTRKNGRPIRTKVRIASVWTPLFYELVLSKPPGLEMRYI